MLASEVMDRVAVLLNDRARTTWTYEVLLPYLQIAWDELLIELENNHLKGLLIVLVNGLFQQQFHLFL